MNRTVDSKIRRSQNGSTLFARSGFALGSLLLVVLGGVQPCLAQFDQDMNPIPPGGLPTNNAPPPASAPAGGVQIFNDQSAFLMAAGSVTTEDFEDEPLSGVPDEGGVIALTFDDFSAMSDVPALKILNVESVGNHNTTPGGIQYLGIDTDTGGLSAAATIIFDTAISKFGLFIIDLDSANILITINGETYNVPANGDGGESYFGIISNTSFSEIDFMIGTDGNGFDSFYSFDDVAYDGTPSVPAVSDLGVLVLTVTLLIGATVVLLRRRRSTV